MMEYFDYDKPFVLESGAVLSSLRIAYHTYGVLNAKKDNAIWVCHALTANSAAADWWKGLVGEDCLVDASKYYIVCANMPGSCYGSTGPASIDPLIGEPYYASFPMVTIRDIVEANILLRKHLGIEKIYLLMGGSMGGYQVLEWSVMEKDVVEKLFLIATSPSESAWGVAIHTTQRLAIEADNTWQNRSPDAGAKGLKAARAIGMLTYRNYDTFQEKQTDSDPEKIDDFKASSYINYQGDKLVKRFNAYSYWLLTKAMDSHHLGRGRGGNLIAVLQSIQQPTMIIGITSDILCPLAEQRFMATHMPNATLVEIDSAYGHDGFIIETAQITEHLGEMAIGLRLLNESSPQGMKFLVFNWLYSCDNPILLYHEAADIVGYGTKKLYAHWRKYSSSRAMQRHIRSCKISRQAFHLLQETGHSRFNVCYEAVLKT